MRRFWICSGVDGRVESLERLRRAVEMRRPDAILFAGGILSPTRLCAMKMVPWSLTEADAAFVETFFATLNSLGVFCAVIPGPGGEPREEFFRLALWAEVVFPHVHVVHATMVEQGDTAIAGIGGVMSEERLCGVDTITRTTAEYFLRGLWRTTRPHKVLLLASAPPGLLGGPQGLPLVGDLIDSLCPNLCVVADGSERRGTQRVGHTLVVNPGRLADGWATWLDWNQPADKQVEIVDLAERSEFEHPDREGLRPVALAVG
jgi:Icc-related predicted phosphoesterase